jgi:hypothetical protein
LEMDVLLPRPTSPLLNPDWVRERPSHNPTYKKKRDLAGRRLDWTRWKQQVYKSQSSERNIYTSRWKKLWWLIRDVWGSRDKAWH